MTTTKLKLLLVLPIVALALGFLALPHSAKAASTYTVDSIGDETDDNPGDLVCHTTSDTCTLRAAIQEVNAGTGGDTINFGIAGTGVHTLTPASAYPTISQSVTIDGYSQPGAAANTAVAPAALNGTLTIEIDGTGAGNCSGLVTDSVSGVSIQGLVIHSFQGHGINIQNSDNVQISGNYIGTDTSGSVAEENTLDGVAGNTSAFTVGGTAPAARNLISGNKGNAGIEVNSGPGGVTIQGNLIGTDVTGMLSISNNNQGVYLGNPGAHLVGGTASGATNVISGNNDNGIQVASDNNTIQGNYLGLNSAGTGSISNGTAGVAISNHDNNLIGGTTAAARNVILNSTAAFGGVLFFNTQNNTVQGNYIGTDKNGNVVPGQSNKYGVGIVNGSINNLIGGVGVGEANKLSGNGIGAIVYNIISLGLDPLNNSIIGNDIEQNTGSGIRLCNDTDFNFECDTPEPYPNDAGDPDVGPNMFMNFPVINSATKGTGQVTVDYDLDINPAEVGATGYSVDFYANSTNAREGAIYLGSDVVPGSVTGQSATLTLPGSVPADYYVTAVTTMTDVSSDGYGHSSEFSAPIQAIAASPTPDPTPTPSPSGTSSSSLADTGQAQHTNQRLFIALALIAAGVLGIAGLTTQRIYSKKKRKGRA